MPAPDKAMVVGAVVVKVPPPTLAELVATVKPAGSVSVKATPVSAVVLPAGLVMVKVKVLVPLTAGVVGLKAPAMVGGATTWMLAEAVPPVPPSAEVTLPVVAFWVPAAMPVTLIEKVKLLLA